MRILGIDTSTRFLVIGVFDGLNIYEYSLDLGKGHDVFLIEHIDRILKVLKMKLKDLDYLAVGLGPGSFTGTRLGVAVIKGLALVLNKKVIGVSTLDIIACNALNLKNISYICPVLDAKRNLVYTSLYKKDNFSLKKIMPFSLLDIETLIRKIPEGTAFLGDGLNLYRNILLLKTKNSILLDEEFFWPKATNLIILALEQIKKRRFDIVNKIKPLYLYPKECQIRQFLNKG